MRKFEVLEFSISVIEDLSSFIHSIERVDKNLGSQIRRAATSISLNIAEGDRRSGKDRLYHFRVASGSANELRTALRVAVAWKIIRQELIAPVLKIIDKIVAILWKLTH